MKKWRSITALMTVLLSGMPVFAATSISYTYDSLARLESATRSDGPGISYTYDPVNNFSLTTGSNPQDTDGDSLVDSIELTFGFNINLFDTDNDGLSDYDEVCYDGNCIDYNPYNPVTNIFGTDLDGSKLDTDGDGFSDADEIAGGSDPLNSSSVPMLADGDINDDGQVNIIDVLLVLRSLNGQLTLTADQMLHGDVAPLTFGVPSPNGVIDVGDLLVIQRKALGQINF